MKLFSLLTLLLFPITVLGNGLSVSPASFNIKINNQESISQNLNAANPTNNVMLFEVYIENEIANKFLSIKPKTFTLESGENKKIQIFIDATQAKIEQILSGEISIIGKALSDSEVNVLTGAKIPFNITITQTKPTPKPYFASILALVIIVILLKITYTKKAKV